MKKWTFLVVWMLAGWLQAQAQVVTAEQVFTSPDSLLKDIGTVLGRSANPKADSLLSSFTNVVSGLSDTQKQALFGVTKSLHQKGLRGNHLENLFTTVQALAQGTRMPAAQLDSFLVVAEQTLAAYPNRVVANFLEHSRRFLVSEEFFRFRQQSTTITGSDFTFAFVPDPEAATAVVEELPIATDTVALDEEEGTKDWFDGVEEEEEAKETEETDWNDADAWDDAEEEESSWEVLEEDTAAVAVDPIMALPYSPEINLPAVVGPMIRMSGASFLLTSVYDSVVLANVRGALLLKDHVFVGDSAVFTWKSVGLDPENVFCELKAFHFNAFDMQIEADDARLTYRPLLENPIDGAFLYKNHVYNRRPSKAIYPQFRAFENVVAQRKLTDNLVYTGGLAMKGRTLASDSEIGGESAVSYLSDGGNVRFTARSKKGFVYADSVLSSPQAKVVIHYSEQDSLWHPATIFKYHVADTLLRARRDKDAFQVTPFTDTRNDVTVDADYLQWHLNADTLDLMILNSRDRIPLVVESKDYYNQELFRMLRGPYPFHPLQMAVGYAVKEKRQTFSSYEISQKHKLNQEVVKGAMIELAKRGYVEYNYELDQVTILRKGFLYYYINNGKQVDFDNMRMTSRVTDRPNLTISIKESNFKLEGVKGFMLSDSLKVAVTPKGGQVNLKDGRNTSFGGEMRVGNFVFRGPEFNYSYDSFKVDLDIVDSIAIMATHQDGKLKEISNKIVNTGGTVYMGDPKNKSGIKANPKYPLLDATKGATVFFNRKEILGGAYDERVRFDMPAFQIDSLNSSNTDIIALEGTFKTGGIFKDFPQIITIDKSDYSFGFKKDFGSQGTEIYGGKGQYHNKLSLNNKGLRGQGSIDYLAGAFESKDFIFYSDSVKTFGENGEIEFSELNGASFPSVIMKKYEMRWLVNADTMQLYSQDDNPFTVFDPKTTFRGMLSMSPRGLSGNGKVETPESTNESKYFAMEGTNYSSTGSHFVIKSDDPRRPAMIGNQVGVHYDLADRQAVINIEDEKMSSYSFPYTKYESTISQITWDLDQRRLLMSVDVKDNASGLGRFVSANSAQDSLEVFATNAIYDLKQHVLNLEGVPGINVANVRIIPDSNKVYIRENADMQPLQNAVVQLNAINKYHILEKANIKIHSRRKFTGEGTYHYSFGVKDTFDILFSDFSTKLLAGASKKDDSKYVTIAKAQLDEEQAFVFTPGVKFKGDLQIVDTDQYLHFKGQAALTLDRPDNKWFTYASKDQETHGVIMVDENITEAGFPTKLTSGIYVSMVERNPYATLLEFDRERVRDKPLFVARGQLYYDDTKGVYSVMPDDRKKQRSFKGNFYEYDYTNKQVKFEGELSLIESTDEYQLKASGLGQGNFDTIGYVLNTAMYVMFENPAKSMEAMAANLTEVLEGIPLPNQADYERRVKMAQLLDEKQLEAFEDKFRDGEESFANYLGDGICLPLVRMKWSEEFKAFYSVGDFAIGNVFKGDVKSQIGGYIEIPKVDGDNALRIFLMQDRETWYYFSFDKTGIRTLASNPEYNAGLTGRNYSGKIKLATFDDVMGYTSSFRMNYLGNEELLDILMPEDVDPFASSPSLDSQIKKANFKDTGEKKKDTADDDDDGF